MSQNGTGRWPLAIFAFSFVIGLLMVFVAFDQQSLVDTKFDPYYFGEMGKSVARGDGFATFGTLLKRRSPLYPAAIGAVYFVFGEQPRLVQLLQCLMLAATCVLVFDMGRRVFNTRTGVIAGVVCAINPMMLRYVADLHLETQLTFLFTLAVWSSVRYYERPTIGRGVTLGVAVGLATLTKAVVILFPGVFVVALLAFRWWRLGWSAIRSFPWASAAAIFVVMLALIAPWTIRNYRVTGHFVLVSSGFNDAFLRGYIFSKTDYVLLRRPPYTDAENESNALFRSLLADVGSTWERDDYETEQVLGREVRRRLAAEPGEFVRKFVVGLFAFWYEMTSLPNSLVAGLMALGAWILATVACVRGWRESRPVWLFIIPALHLNLLLAVLLALGRYSVPVLPSLWVAAAYGADWLLPRRERLGV